MVKRFCNNTQINMKYTKKTEADFKAKQGLNSTILALVVNQLVSRTITKPDATSADNMKEILTYGVSSYTPLQVFAALSYAEDVHTEHNKVGVMLDKAAHNLYLTLATVLNEMHQEQTGWMFAPIIKQLDEEGLHWNMPERREKFRFAFLPSSFEELAKVENPLELIDFLWTCSTMKHTGYNNIYDTVVELIDRESTPAEGPSTESNEESCGDPSCICSNPILRLIHQRSEELEKGVRDLIAKSKITIVVVVDDNSKVVEANAYASIPGAESILSIPFTEEVQDENYTNIMKRIENTIESSFGSSGKPIITKHVIKV